MLHTNTYMHLQAFPLAYPLRCTLTCAHAQADRQATGIESTFLHKCACKLTRQGSPIAPVKGRLEHREKVIERALTQTV
jgi:hypothetical protein